MKAVFIHVGPPKTGTSAIQNFLATNQDLLSNLGIYYPQHAVDKNGISSGNYTSIYSSTQRKVVDTDKVASLLNSFRNSKNSILLLSSEGFFDRMNEIAAAIPKAQFIYYMRNPLDYMESTYNQSVKRQRNTEPLSISVKKPDLSKVKVLEKYIQANGTKNLKLRYYHPACFHSGDIVSDFFTAMGIDSIPRAKSKQINLSYSFEALEFKRQINRLNPSPYCQYLLDKTLQTHQGIMSYSLISPDTYSELRQAEIEYLTIFFAQHNIAGSEGYLATLKREKQKTYKAQHLTFDQWKEMGHFIYSTTPELFVHLTKLIENNRNLLPQEADAFVQNIRIPPLLTPIYRTSFKLRQKLNALYKKLN